MNLTDLSYFLLVAEERSFTRAAQKLYISQQALSSRIARLENKYQTALFERDIPLRLTDAGSVLYESASQILGTMERCDRRIQEISDCTKGSLSVGIPVTRGIMMLPQLCASFHQMHPQISLEIFEGQTTAMVEEKLLEGKLDLSVGYIPADTTKVISHVLYTEHYELAVPIELFNSTFPPETRKQLLSRSQPLNKFFQLPFVVQNRAAMGGQVFWKMCKEASFEPQTVLVTENLLTQINLCIAGMGACVVPSTFLKKNIDLQGMQSPGILGSERHAKIAVIQLNSTLGTAPVAVNRLRTGMLTQAGKEFIALAQFLFYE